MSAGAGSRRIDTYTVGIETYSVGTAPPRADRLSCARHIALPVDARRSAGTDAERSRRNAVPHQEEHLASMARITSLIHRTSRGRLVLLSSVVVGLLAAPLAMGATCRHRRRRAQPQQQRLQRLQQGDPDHRHDRPEPGRSRRPHRRLRDPPVQQVRHRRRRDLRLPGQGGTEACVAANNLNNGDAFRFQSDPRPPPSASCASASTSTRRSTSRRSPPTAPDWSRTSTPTGRRKRSAEDFVDQGQCRCSPWSPPTARSPPIAASPPTDAPPWRRTPRERGVHRPVRR